MARKPPIRWYADESVLGFGKLLAEHRDDITFPGHPRARGLKPGMLDTEWMPRVASLGWVAFHRDRRIRTRPLELRLFREQGLRAVWFGGRSDLAPSDQLELALRHWARLERDVVRLGAGPWALTLTTSGLQELPLRDMPTGRPL